VRFEAVTERARNSGKEFRRAVMTTSSEGGAGLSPGGVADIPRGIATADFSQLVSLTTQQPSQPLQSDCFRPLRYPVV
jgi:hypothetical protein